MLRRIDEHREEMSIKNQRYGQLITQLVQCDIKDSVIVLSSDRFISFLEELELKTHYDWIQIGDEIALQRARLR